MKKFFLKFFFWKKTFFEQNFFFIFFLFFYFLFFYTSFPLLSLFSCRLNWERKKNSQKKKNSKSQLFFLFFSNGSAEKKSRQGTRIYQYQYLVEAAWLQIATKATMLRTRDDGLLAQTGGMTEILRVCFISSILRHILSWLSAPNVGIERQKISRRDAELPYAYRSSEQLTIWEIPTRKKENEEEEEGVIDIRINNKFLSLKKWPILASFSTFPPLTWNFSNRQSYDLLTIIMNDLDHNHDR